MKKKKKNNAGRIAQTGVVSKAELGIKKTNTVVRNQEWLSYKAIGHSSTFVEYNHDFC